MRAYELTESVSNYNRLTNIALKKFDEMVAGGHWPSGKFSIKNIELPHGYFKYKVSVEWSPNIQRSLATSYDNRAIVEITTNNYQEEINGKWGISDDLDKNIKHARMTLAHEMTHVSQKINGFLDYEREQREKNSNNPAFDYEINHHKAPSEHEAVLVEIGTYLMDGNIDAALQRFQQPSYDREKYFNTFTRKQLIQKWASMGVSGPVMKEFFNRFKEFYDAQYQELYDMIYRTKWDNEKSVQNVFLPIRMLVRDMFDLQAFKVGKKEWVYDIEKLMQLHKNVLKPYTVQRNYKRYVGEIFHYIKKLKEI
jgi:hypothetical protein